MSNRRKVIAAGAAAALDAAGWMFPEAPRDPACVRPGSGPNAGYFPNVVLTSHEGERALFYDDLLLGKTVLIHCMSIAGDADYPVIRNVARVQPYLGERLGRDVFIYSLSVDPRHDTPRRLADLARERGAQPGWRFLTGEPADVEAVRGRLFAQNPGLHRHGAHAAHDCSVGLMKYGNEAVGVWGSVPAKASPEWIARRLSWVAPRDRPARTFRRGGPHPRKA